MRSSNLADWSPVDILGLLEFCDPNYPSQAENVRALADPENWTDGRPSVNKAAKAVGRDRRGVARQLKSVQARAELRGYAPQHDQVHSVPEAQIVAGVSTYYSTDPETDEIRVRGQWVKTKVSQSAQLRLIRDWVEGLADGILPRPPVNPPPKGPADRQPVFILGDPHAGLLAWGEETGADYDLDIWAKEHRGKMAQLIDDAPETESCVIINLGDYFHSDGHQNTTTKGTQVDLDTRQAKVFREGRATFEFMIDYALQKYHKVIVYITRGNHDWETSFALSEVLWALYRNEPRVEIRGGIKTRMYHEFGINLLGITHGDKTKPAQMPAVMAAEHPRWSDFKVRRAICGHEHHQYRKEYPGCIVEVFPTLARSDAWHAGEGYISEKSASCMILHATEGETGRLWANLIV